MLIVFFDIRGLVHHEFILREQGMNKEYYLAALKCFDLNPSKTVRFVEMLYRIEYQS